MALQGATVTVAAGATYADIVGVFGASYQPTFTPGWITDYGYANKTAAGFRINFGVPVPPGGSTYSWNVADSTSTSQAITQSSQAVLAGATQSVVALAASLPSSYQVSPITDWVTSRDVIGRTATGFTVEYGTPAPPGGGTLGFIIFGPNIGIVSLSDYLSELRDLLGVKATGGFWSATQLGDYINRAMRRRDIDTAVNRSTISYTLTAATGRYTFTTLGNGQIVDILNIFLILGTTRALLDNPPLSTLNELWRYSTTQSGRTAAWSRQGPSTVIFGPTPGSAYPIEIDAVVYGTPLVSLTDTDPLPYPYTQPVPYYAAYLAKINERESDEKNEFWDAYQELVGFATSGRAPQMPSAGRR